MAEKNMPKGYDILVVGCGGTGSAFLQSLIPYLVHRPQDALPVSVTICDGDTVEEKNLARQVFFPDQVGLNKALALAESIEGTFDYRVKVVSRYLEDFEEVNSCFRPHDKIPVLVGCVDNLKARAIYEGWFEKQKSAIYIDCANEEFRGEVVYAAKFEGKLLSPLRSRVFPSVKQLLAEEVKSGKFRSEEDCLARSLSGGAQHIFTNKMSALLAANAVSVMLENNRPPLGMDIFSMRPILVVRHEDTSSLLPKMVHFETSETKGKGKGKKRKREAG